MPLRPSKHLPIIINTTRLLRQIRQEFEEAIGLHGYLFGFWDGGQAVVL
jgi:hypothetical protein